MPTGNHQSFREKVWHQPTRPRTPHGAMNILVDRHSSVFHGFSLDPGRPFSFLVSCSQHHDASDSCVQPVTPPRSGAGLTRPIKGAGEFHRWKPQIRRRTWSVPKEKDMSKALVIKFHSRSTCSWAPLRFKQSAKAKAPAAEAACQSVEKWCGRQKPAGSRV